MLSQSQIDQLAKSRLLEAEALLDAGSFADGAVYLCGYAVELGLKAAILRTRLTGFPGELEEFKLFEEVKTHDLEKLLKVLDDSALTNDKEFFIAWQNVKNWRSELRYRPIGEATNETGRETVIAARVILNRLGIPL